MEADKLFLRGKQANKQNKPTKKSRQIKTAKNPTTTKQYYFSIALELINMLPFLLDFVKKKTKKTNKKKLPAGTLRRVPYQERPA